MREKYDNMRPYRDDEIPAAMRRIINHQFFPLLASYVFPDTNIEDIKEKFLTFETIQDFQENIMYYVNKQILKRSIKSFTFSGLENLHKDKSYLFVSNHRDIMLDAALLQQVLFENNFKVCEITFGANLMSNDLIIDIGKSNKMFKVERGAKTAKEFYKSSEELSSYIRYVITEKNDSVWIAQRNGRTKNGNDVTDQGIISMFCVSKANDKVTALAELNIVPVSVSYEWEPCDILKALELIESKSGQYTKKPGEDINSILTGITQYKGNVHFSFCKPIGRDELEEIYSKERNRYNKAVAELIDKRVYSGYKLFPNNYIAFDLKHKKEEFSHKYTPQQKEEFIAHLNKLENYPDKSLLELQSILINIYATPVENGGF